MVLKKLPDGSCVDGSTTTGNSDAFLNRRQANPRSSMWTGFERNWGCSGSGFRRGHCVTTRMLTLNQK